MVTVPQYIGQITDLFSLISFLVIILIIEPKLRGQYNIAIGLISIVGISFIDTIYNMASIPLLAILYFFLLQKNQLTTFKWIIDFIIALLFTFITAQLASNLTIKILRLQLGKIDRQLLHIVILDLVFTIVLTTVLLIVRYFIMKLLDKIDIEQSFAAAIFGYNAVALIIFLTLADAVTRSIGQVSDLMPLFLGIFGILVFIMLFVTILLYSQKIKALQLSHKKERTKDNTLYIKELEKKYQEARKAKHDYKNTLLTLQVIAKNSKNDTLYTNVSNLLQSDTNSDDNDSKNLALQKIDDALINGVISQKLTEAQDANIKTTLEITKEIPELGKINIIITRILGILMDNAIEAASDSKEKLISVAVINEAPAIEFIIRNTVAQNTDINIDQIFEEGYSSKGSSRGLGLSTVQDLISHYNNMLISVKYTDTFTAILTLEDII